MLYEVEKMPGKTDEVCTICEEAITNPICPECLINEMQLWAYDYDPKLADIIRDMIFVFTGYDNPSSTCVLCSAKICICPHCVAKEVYEHIASKAPDLAPAFLRRFNYELDYRFCLK